MCTCVGVVVVGAPGVVWRSWRMRKARKRYSKERHSTGVRGVLLCSCQSAKAGPGAWLEGPEGILSCTLRRRQGGLMWLGA